MRSENVILENGTLTCVLSSAGAAIADMVYHMPGGKDRRVALSPVPNPKKADPSLAGRTVAPCCGRIRCAEIEIGGQKIALTKNEGPNHIHGGPGGAAFRVWDIAGRSENTVRFTLKLAAGEDGYPGNRQLTAEYTLDGATLSVRYRAETDAATFMDITNHAYWDVTGRFDGSAMDTLLEVPSLAHVVNAEDHLPLRIVPSEGTAFDFTNPAASSEQVRKFPNEEQLRIARGFNNALIIDRELAAARGFAARLTDPVDGVRMTMRTDQPCIVFYSGGFLGADTPIPEGHAVPGAALALEAQGLPDPFHLDGTKAEILKPGEVFEAGISWTIGMK